MRIAFLDAIAGVAGDMFLGALLDLEDDAFDLETLRAAIRGMGLAEVEVSTERVRRASIAACRLQVEAGRQPMRHLRDLCAAVDAGDLPTRVRARSKAVFEAIARVEAAVHGTDVDQVHFHEIGAADTIVDVVGVCLGVERLGIERVYATPVTVGTGTVRCAHGEMPVPPPGALGNLLGIPVRSGVGKGECTTPTGAALLSVLVDAFEPELVWRPSAVGCGAGTRDDPELPNLLRITLGDVDGEGLGRDTVVQLDCNLDVADGETLAWLIDGALARGARDAFAQPVVMKKGRPGHVLSVLARADVQPELERFLLEESGTLGVRAHRCDRAVLPRREEVRESCFGPIRFKVATLPSGVEVARPEDDEVRRLCSEHALSRREVLRRLAAR